MHEVNSILSKKILHWYDNNKRILPWRIKKPKNKKDYYTLVSEFMLQQTQVKSVIPYFKEFVLKVPNLKALSKCSEKKILKLWEGLGYYNRAKNLCKTAKILVKKHKSKLPNEYKKIIELPGVGKYTANSLLALAYNKSCIPVDGNVKRVFSRLFLINSNNQSLYNEVEKIKNRYLKTKRNADLAEGLMEFGAVICKPLNPQCNICCLKKNCMFYKNGKYPFQKEKTYIKEKKFNIYCYLNKSNKQIALTKNKNLTFLKNFRIPKIQVVVSSISSEKSGWSYLCNYKNNISNIKMNINLFYKFTKNKPKNFNWYYLSKSNNEFIPSFTKKIIKKLERIYF